MLVKRIFNKLLKINLNQINNKQRNQKILKYKMNKNLKFIAKKHYKKKNKLRKIIF